MRPREPWKKIYGLMTHSASTVTIEDLRYIFEKQGRKCYWLGIPLDPNNNYIANHPLAISVDRLDNSRGYHRNNIVICSRFANLGRGPFDPNQFIGVITLIKKYLRNPLSENKEDNQPRLWEEE